MELLTTSAFYMEENIGQKILSKDLENIVKKVASGKTLTSTERAIVEKAYGQKEESVKYAETTTELADILGVARQTINKWRKIKGSPKPYSNGKHSVSKWRDFVRKHDLKEPDSPEDEELKTRKLLAEVKQAEIKLKVMEGTYVAIEKVREVWTAHCPYRTSTANLGKQIFKRASSNSYNPRCSTNSGEIAGGTRRDLQGNLYCRRLDKGACGGRGFLVVLWKKQSGCASVPLGYYPNPSAIWEFVFG